jgi:uncharacterized membrane protein (UPF0127 family)
VLALRRAAIVLVVVAAACSHGPAPRRAVEPQVIVAPPGLPAAQVAVELARTAAEQSRGLMYRDHLEPGHGMLFLFDQPHHLTFWMHNTYIPLDLIFIGADHRVVGVVENAEPLTDAPRGVDGDSQFVLEVPAGWAAAHRIAPGAPVRFVGVD